METLCKAERPKSFEGCLPGKEKVEEVVGGAMKVYSCKRVFVEDRFVENVNIFVLGGKIIYVGPDEPYLYSEKELLGEVWPAMINLDVPELSFKVLGYLMSYGERFFLDRSEKDFVGVPLGVMGKIGRYYFGVNLRVETLREGVSEEKFSEVLEGAKGKKLFVKLVDYAVSGPSLFRRLVKAGFPVNR